MYHLCKAKRLDHEEWVEGNLVVLRKVEPIPIGGALLIPCDGNVKEKEAIVLPVWYSVNSDTICFFIGMTDRNGEKIWEYDLIRDPFGSVFLAYWNMVQCAYYGFLLQQKNGKRVRGCFPIGAFRHFAFERMGSIFDKGMVQRRWMVYFCKWICYSVYSKG